MAKINSAFIAICILMSLVTSTDVVAEEKSITIRDEATYEDERSIPYKIRKECTQLGRQFSDSTERFLSKAGWAVNRSDSRSGEGLELNLVITNAYSAGNAWIGHRKSVTIEAQLFKNGEMVDHFEAVRDSSGGFAGGFKGSCDVLHRCVNTLGKDVTEWLADISGHL